MTQRMTKKLLRPRWIAVGLLVAVTAATAALVATTTATSADAIPFSNPAHPVRSQSGTRPAGRCCSRR